MCYYNGPQRTQNNKQAAAGTTMDITLPIPETQYILQKPGSATSNSTIKAPYNIGLLTTYGIKKLEEKITCKTLHQYRCCLINGIFNTVEPLQSCAPD
jgi:hypothetical protein